MENRSLTRVRRQKGVSKKETQYVVSLWFTLRHTTDVIVRASGHDEAVMKVEDMVESGESILAGAEKDGKLLEWGICDGAHPCN